MKRIKTRQPLSQEQIEWFQNTALTQTEPNPCVRLFGTGPAWKQCKDCTHLYRNHIKYYKCDLRKHTNGPGSDHRVRWKACARFEQR